MSYSQFVLNELKRFAMNLIMTIEGFVPPYVDCRIRQYWDTNFGQLELAKQTVRALLWQHTSLRVTGLSMTRKNGSSWFHRLYSAWKNGSSWKNGTSRYYGPVPHLLTTDIVCMNSIWIYSDVTHTDIVLWLAYVSIAMSPLT